jgi:hypothetical protein
MSGNEVIVENSLPTIYNLTVSANEYCVGSGGIDLLLDGTDSDIIYEIYDSETPTGITLTGTGSTITFTGLMTGDYTIVATNDVTDCIETMSGNEIIIEALIYEFITTESICAGDSIEWRGNWYSEQDAHTETYASVYGCDSLYVLDLTVNPLPTNYVVMTDPNDGLLYDGETGSISVSDSELDVAVEYWVALGTETQVDGIYSTGNPLLLADGLIAGTYEIWSQVVETGCIRKQGNATFIDVVGLPKIVVSISYGADTLSVANDSATVSMTEIEIIDNDTIFTPYSTTDINNGFVEFTNIPLGDYVMLSKLDSTYGAISNWYYGGGDVESAIIVSIEDLSDILSIRINHPMISDTSEGLRFSISEPPATHSPAM